MYCPLTISKPDNCNSVVQNPKIIKCFILQNCSSSSIECSLFDLTASQCIQKRTSCIIHVQCTGGFAVCLHRGAPHQHRRGTPSALMRVCSTDQSHHQHCGGCAKWTSYIISMEERVLQYRTTKTVQGVLGGCI